MNGQFEYQHDCSRVSLLLKEVFLSRIVVSFQDCRFLAIGTSREDNLCNEMSQDGVIVCHSSSKLLYESDVIYYMYIPTSVTS